MNTSDFKIGLTLSGGGAKGAYEVGVVKALSSMGFEPSVITGASIGALNGAILASAKNFQSGVEAMESVWRSLDPANLIAPNISVEKLIGLAGMHITLSSVLAKRCLTVTELIKLHPNLKKIFNPATIDSFAFFDHSPIQEVIKKSINFKSIKNQGNCDFFVAVSPGHGGLGGAVKDIVRYGLNKGEAHFLNLADFSEDDAINILLASASIPIALPAVTIDGIMYRDGGMGGRIKCQGNTPVTPMVEAKCSHVITVILDKNCLWDRYEWPFTPLEIRPSDDLGGLLAAADFSPSRISELIEMGERDTVKTLNKIKYFTDEIRQNIEGRILVENAVHNATTEPAAYVDIMGQIDSIS